MLDLDGNTIEAVHHVGHDETASTVSRRSTRSASTLKPHPETEIQLAKEADIDNEAADSAVEIPRATLRTTSAPLPSQLGNLAGQVPTNSIFGSLIGAAAGAAAIYTFYSMERDSAREEEEAFNIRISRRHSSTGAKPDMNQYRSVHSSNSRDYRRHSEPAFDIPSTRPSQQRYIENNRSPEMPLFRRSFTTNAAPTRHSHSLRRNITYDTAINTIAEAPECPDPPAAVSHGAISSTASRRSRRQRQDQIAERPSGKLLEWRSPSRQRRSRSQSHSHSRRSQSPGPASRPLPSSRVGSRYTAPLSYISATLGNSGADSRTRADDAETVMPDDSISCVDLRPRSSRRSSTSHSSKYSTRSNKDRDHDRDDRSERTVRPSTAQRSSHGERREVPRATERRSSTVSLPSRPRETTRRYRYEVRERSRSRSRERSDGRGGRRRDGTRSLA